MAKIIGIARVIPPGGPMEEPFLTPQGFKMADPYNGPNRHHAEYAIYLKTLEEVDAGLKRGWSLWMKQPGKRETLISASSLRVR